MAIANNFTIGANDEHGLNPPTLGKRTPILPYIDRSFYENEFNSITKRLFIQACLRCGFNIYDVKPEVQDISISTRITRVNRQQLSALITFAYNAFGSGNAFNSGNGFEIFYYPSNANSNNSRRLSIDIYNRIAENNPQNGRGVNTLNVSILSRVNCPSTLIEAGFMTNFEEAKLMLDPLYNLLIAESTCQGVCDYFNVSYVARDNISAYATLRINSRGNQVELLQYLLNEYGANLEPDGVFGANTENAVRNFQNDNGLTADGIVGPNTWRRLLLLDLPETVLRRGGNQNAVYYLQRKLLSNLYPITSLDGDFGPETERAVRAFQQENGLTIDGIVGPNTWGLLTQLGGGRPQV